MRATQHAPRRKPQRSNHGQSDQAHPDWATLLVDAVSKPGLISQAYSRFWNYSVGNQIMALFQCLERGIELGPIHTFRGRLDLGRHVKRGEKAITLCMPVTVKRKLSDPMASLQPVRVGDGAERQLTGPGGVLPKADQTVGVTVFTYKPHWFVLPQTDGEGLIRMAFPMDNHSWESFNGQKTADSLSH